MKHFVIFITILGLVACRDRPLQVQRITAAQTAVDSTLVPDDSLEAYIRPYREHVAEELNAPLSFAPMLYSKSDGALNTSIGNLMADIVREQTDTLMSLQNKLPVDLVVLNHGGIRSVISPGPVSQRTAYEVMPFENTIAVVSLTGPAMRSLFAFLAESGRPHPISGMEITLQADGQIGSVRIGGQPFNEDRVYRVATSDYLLGGGDDMGFFASGQSVETTGYKIRNALIDYFRRTDTLRAAVDGRFTKMEER